MHGVQPIAKIAPSVNAAPRPDAPADEPGAHPAAHPAAARRRERHPAGRRREARGGAGVERPPGPLQEPDVDDPGEAEAHDHEDRRRR